MAKINGGVHCSRNVCTTVHILYRIPMKKVNFRRPKGNFPRRIRKQGIMGEPCSSSGAFTALPIQGGRKEIRRHPGKPKVDVKIGITAHLHTTHGNF